MITGINRLQRPGRSYLHGILRDGARPYAYRSGARRLLQAEHAAGLRPLYGNHFMPVSFRYLDAHYGLEYGPSAAPGSFAAEPVPGPAAVPRTVSVQADDGPVAMPRGDRPATVVPAAEPESRRPAAQPPAPTTTAGAQPAVVDIMIPDARVHKAAVRTEARAAAPAVAPAVQQDLGDTHSPTPSLRPLPKPAVESGTEARAKPAAQPAVPAAPLPQRLPANLSLKGLAEMLERQNFEKPAPAPAPAPAQDAARIPEVRHRSELPATGMEPLPGAVPDVRTAMTPLPTKRIAAVKPAVLAAPPRMTTAPRIYARPPEPRLPMPMPRRAGPAPRRPLPQQQATQPPGREPQRRAGVARAPQRKQLRGPRRVSIVRRTAPAAFWERSYLSSPELRLYR